MSQEITPSAQKPPFEDNAPAPAPPAPAPSTKPRQLRSRRKKVPKAAKEKKKLPPPTRMTDAGYGALKALKAANPEMSHTQIVSAALIAMAGQTAYMPPIQLRRIATEELLIMAGIVADAEAALKTTFRNIIRAKIDPAKKASLAEEIEMDLRKLRQLRRTICRIAGIPLNASYDLDANDLIEELTEKMESASSLIQIRYRTGIEILAAYTCSVEEEPPMLDDSTTPPTFDH